MFCSAWLAHVVAFNICPGGHVFRIEGFDLDKCKRYSLQSLYCDHLLNFDLSSFLSFTVPA